MRQCSVLLLISLCVCVHWQYLADTKDQIEVDVVYVCHEDDLQEEAKEQKWDAEQLKAEVDTHREWMEDLQSLQKVHDSRSGLCPLATK